MVRTSQRSTRSKVSDEKMPTASVEGTPVKRNSKSPRNTKSAQAPTSPKVKEHPVSSQKEFGYISKSQTEKAIEELRNYLERSKADALTKSGSGKSDLFETADDAGEEQDGNTNLYVKFQFKKYLSSRAVLKPKLIALSNPYLTQQKDLKTCMFIRDGMIKNEDNLIQLESAGIPTLLKVLTLNQLKTIYRPYEKRYQLLDEYDVFITDDAILSSLPSTLGKPFYNATPKSPVAVRVTSKEKPRELCTTTLESLVNQVLRSTAYLPPFGIELTVRVGSLDSKFTTEQLLANIHDVLQQFSEKVLVTAGLATTQLPVLPLFYTDKLYSDEDILENVKQIEQDQEDDAYTKALLELADEDSVADVLGKKFKESRKRRKLNSKASV